jgi:hypothetical protein
VNAVRGRALHVLHKDVSVSVVENEDRNIPRCRKPTAASYSRTTHFVRTYGHMQICDILHRVPVRPM